MAAARARLKSAGVPCFTFCRVSGDHWMLILDSETLSARAFFAALLGDEGTRCRSVDRATGLRLIGPYFCCVAQ